MNRKCRLCDVILSSAIVSLLFFNCTSTQETRDTIKTQNTQNTIEKYEQEGFITKDLYRIIIVKPDNSQMNDADLEKQIKSKTLASIKKYITSKGKSLTSNTNAEIINLINNYGVFKTYKDSTCNLLILDISRQGCRSYIDSLGQ
jgi:hypothetical protein